jgi:hypothetical protein
MRDARPNFQHDGAFQFAQDAGFDTTPARAPLDLPVVVTFDAPSAFISSVPRGALDLAVVVTFAVTSRGPVEEFGGGVGVWEIPRRRRYVADLEIAAVVTWDPSSRFHAAPVRRRPAMPRARRRRLGHAEAAVECALTYAAPSRGFDYVREVVVPDDDDVLLLAMRQFTAGAEDDELVLLDGGRV